MANSSAIPHTSGNRSGQDTDPSTGSGTGASASAVHNCDIRLALAPVHAGMVHLGHRPRAIPDAVHPFDEPISHGVAGSDAMWPQISESSARPPGDGNPMPCK